MAQPPFLTTFPGTLYDGDGTRLAGNGPPLTLEMTEGSLMRDAVGAVAVLTALCELGVQLAVDDFGTGYSSLAHLQRFPVHALKVDASFVAHLDSVGPEAAANAAIVAAIVGVAKALGLSVVAEGVETGAELGSLRELGVDSAQGFLLGRPASSPLDKLLAAAEINGAAA